MPWDLSLSLSFVTTALVRVPGETQEKEREGERGGGREGLGRRGREKEGWHEELSHHTVWRSPSLQPASYR